MADGFSEISCNEAFSFPYTNISGASKNTLKNERGKPIFRRAYKKRAAF